MAAIYSLSTLAPATRAEILALRAAGSSCDAIAAALNKRGLRGTAGGRWYGATIHRILQLTAPAGGRKCRCCAGPPNLRPAPPETAPKVDIATTRRYNMTVYSFRTIHARHEK